MRPRTYCTAVLSAFLASPWLARPALRAQALSPGQNSAGPPGNPTPGSPVPPVPVTVRWSVTSYASGCFFFSGPRDLGRDDHLARHATWTRNGGTMTLRFGPTVAFTGPDTPAAIHLVRISAHDFSGKWVVTETIDLVPLGNGWTGRYHYAECDTHNPAQCPGHCSIDATLAISH